MAVVAAETAASPRMAVWERLQVILLPSLFRVLRPLPAPVSEAALAVLGLLQGLLDRGRLRRALDWASSYSAGHRGKWTLALSLLANRGRFLAKAALLGVRDPSAFLRRCVLEGEGVQHLDASARRGGTILLGFHVGPSLAFRVIRRHGYRITSAGEGTRFPWPRPPAAWRSSANPERGRVIRWRDVAARARGLYQLRRLLLRGEIVGLHADGRGGKEAFRVPLLGGSLVVRAGWFALRRETGAVTLPVLTRWECGRLIVTIYPPLPPPASDPGRDVAACRDALAPILEAYAQRFPDQCLSFAFWAGE